MDAHVKTVSQILYSSDQYLVPFFQRRYSWKKVNWQRLLDDIVHLTEAAETKHFLGPLVCTPLNPIPGEVTTYQLIDGQQRLATLTVAIAALRDIAKLKDLGSLGEEIHEQFLVHHRQKGDKRLKVVPRLEDREDYKSILEGTPAGTTASETLLGAYSFFKRAWDGLVKKDGGESEIRKYLVATTARLSLVAITVAGEDPYAIFESLNSTGLPLEESDLVRNYLFMKVPLAEQGQFQSTHWNPFERRFDEAGEYQELSPTSFYRSYLMREGNFCRKQGTYPTFNSFKQQYDARNLKPEEQVRELQRFADFWLWLSQPLTCEDSELRAAFLEIQVLDITTAHPLLLHLLHRHQQGRLDRGSLLGCFTDLASFVIRRSVCGESTRGYDRLFPDAIKAMQIRAREELREFFLAKGWPDDEAFIARLAEFPIYKREPNKCRLILEKLERQHGHKEQLDLRPRTISIEHVLPRTIDGDSEDAAWWRTSLGTDWQAVHQKWLHTLGNLTLTGYNPELGIGTFADKKAEFTGSKVSLNQYFLSLQRWADHEIKQRGEHLARSVAQIWPRPPGGQIYVPPSPPPSDAGGSPETKLKIRVHWSKLGKALPDEDICESTASKTMSSFLAKLIRHFGEPMEEQLRRIRFVRSRYGLSSNPAVDFLNPKRGKPFGHNRVPGTELYVFTNTSTEAKSDDLKKLVKELHFSPAHIEVLLV